MVTKGDEANTQVLAALELARLEDVGTDLFDVLGGGGDVAALAACAVLNEDEITARGGGGCQFRVPGHDAGRRGGAHSCFRLGSPGATGGCCCCWWSSKAGWRPEGPGPSYAISSSIVVSETQFRFYGLLLFKKSMVCMDSRNLLNVATSSSHEFASPPFRI